jgi:hypothetical protein
MIQNQIMTQMLRAKIEQEGKLQTADDVKD